MKKFLRGPLFAVMFLVGCATDESGVTPINKSAVAIQLGTAAAINGAAIAVQTCVLDKASPEGVRIGVAFGGVVGTLDTMNDELQEGNVNAADLLMETAKSALTQVQLALIGLEPTPAQDAAVQARTLPASKASISEIVALVQQFMPIIISGGSTIAQLVESLINNIKAPNGDATLAAVESANSSMHLALSTYAAAGCVK